MERKSLLTQTVFLFFFFFKYIVMAESLTVDKEPVISLEMTSHICKCSINEAAIKYSSYVSLFFTKSRRKFKSENR